MKRKLTVAILALGLAAGAVLNENPALYASHRSTPPSYLKFQFAQLVCEMSGDPVQPAPPACVPGVIAAVLPASAGRVK